MRILDVVINNTLIIAILVEVLASILTLFGKLTADDWLKVTLIILGYAGSFYVGRLSFEQSKA
jgi:hypothetical protein